MPGPYPLVDRDDISGTAPNPDSATARAGFGALWDAFSYLLFSGDNSGTKAQARTALEVYSSTEVDDAITDAVAAKVAGDVLQMVTATDAGSTVTVNTLTNVMGAAGSITPKSTASKLRIEVSFQCRMWDGLYTAEYALYEGGTQLCLYKVHKGHPGTVIGAARDFVPLSISAIVTNTATTARSFTLRARDSAGTTLDVGATSIVMTITEIKT